MGIKKLLCLGLAAAVFCSGFSALTAQARGTEAELQKVTLAADYKADGFQIKNGVLVKYTGKGGNVVVPEGVTSIGNYAFSECSGLSSLVIPKGVTGIGNYAFSRCGSLSSITIPEGVTSIREGTFYGCSSLSSVTIPKGVTGIGEDAFSRCSSLSRVSIPEEVTSIGEGAFSGCISLGSITIPKGVTSIRAGAFSGCSSLGSVTIPKGVTDIENAVFSGCSSLSSIKVAAKNKTYDSRGDCNAIIETKSNTLISGCKNTIIPNSVTSIGHYAFEGCTSLSNVTIPEGVTSIGGYVFLGCSSLKNITIPRTVTSIGLYALGYDYTVEDGYTKMGGFCITGYAGSKAQVYAKEEGFPFVINKVKQKITGTKTYKKTYGDKPFTLDARLTKGDGKISYSSSNPQVISINQKGKATLRGVGISTITVTAKETKNYSKKAFKVKIEVRPGKPALNKIQTKTGRKLAVSWKRDADATGYEVWCSTDKNFKKNCKKAVIRKNKTVSHKFTGLKAGKKYYVRVRSCKTVKVNGKSQTLKSKWSIKQSKKIQK